MSSNAEEAMERLASVLQVDRTDETDLKTQVVYVIARAVAARRIVSGERLPSVTVLAKHLCVSPGTVASAYARLESLGVVRGLQGAGTYVGSPADAIRYYRDRLRERLGRAFTDARGGEFSRQEISEMANAELNKVYGAAS